MKRIIKKLLGILLKIILGFIIFSILAVLVYRFVDPPVTPLMVIRYVQQDKEKRMEYEWRDADAISEHFKLAVIAAEDQRFFDHRGFDLRAIEDAIEKAEKGKRLRGASTISQQVTKNVFLWPSRSWVRKGFEAYFTFLIELFWPKERILEVYVNVVELGDGIYGAQAAAGHFFHHDASHLTKHEAALMAAVLPNPVRFRIASPSAYVRKRQGWIMRQMSNLGSMEYLEKHSK